jgi:hypothetical protein
LYSNLYNTFIPKFNLTSTSLKRILIFSVFLILLNSCTSEFKPTTFKITSIDSSFEADISVTFDKATGHSKLNSAINSNIENTIVNTISYPESKSDLKTVLKKFNLEFINFTKDFPEASEPVWELHIETEILYQSVDIITLAISTYEFQGGAHGNDKIKFLNLNAKSGEVLKQNDIIENRNAFKTLAKKHFIKSLKIKKDQLNTKDLFFGKPFQLPANIGFSDDGLVLLYNVYEVASYDQGYTEFIILFEDAQPYLKVN